MRGTLDYKSTLGYKGLLLSITCILLINGMVSAQSPLVLVQRAAVEDARNLPPGVRIYTRYLYIPSLIPQKDRGEFLSVLTFHCNMLSREAEFGRLRIVNQDLVAINLKDYRWSTKVWERLEENDYIFHAAIESRENLAEEVIEEQEWGHFELNGSRVDRQGREVTKTTPGAVFRTTEIRKVKVQKKVGDKKTKKNIAQAPWLDPPASAELVTLLQTKVPILRADWFMVQTGIQRANDVGYYDFLDVGKKEVDFQKLIGADPELSRSFRKEIAGILGRSGVAINNRRVVRFQGLGGGYWLTEDFISSKGQKNVLNFIDGDTEPPRGDASEQYGVLPNGLFAFYLINKDGVRQDFVPTDTIAPDNHTISNDKKIYAGKSCIACHVEGIRPIDDYARRLYRGAIQLQSPDYDKFVRLRQLYLSDLKKQVSKDIVVYSESLSELNGPNWTPAKNAKAYERYWDLYYEEDWGSERVALSLGTDKNTLITSLKKRASPPPLGTGNLEPILACLIQEPEIPLRIEHLEDNYALLQTILVDPAYVVQQSK